MTYSATTTTGALVQWSTRMMLAGLLAVTTLSVGTAQAAPSAPLVEQQSELNASPAQAASCNPRPRVVVQSEPALMPASTGVIGLPGVDALLVTVSTTGAGKGVRAIRFSSTNNAMVTVLDANAHAAPYEVTFPTGNEPGRISFALWRQDASRASFARLVVVDACGEWTTFVGRGPR